MKRLLKPGIAAVMGGARLFPKASDPLGVKITGQPDSVGNLPEPDGTSFTVVAESGDASPLTYQWQGLDGGDFVDLSDGGVYSGVNTATLIISSTSGFSNTTFFRCEVSNDVNTVSSDGAVLTILLAVSFINGPVTPWDALVGVETTRGPASDFFEGDQPPFTYAETGTVWPSWAVMDPNTGIITGTPDQTSVTNGMTVTATDTNGNTAVSNTFSLTVASGTGAISFAGIIPTITGQVGIPITPVNTALYFSGTEGPFAFTQLGDWPPALTLDQVTGVITGTPENIGTVSGLQVRGIDQNLDTADSNLFDATTEQDPRVTFDLRLTHTLTPTTSAGVGTPTYSRLLDAYVQDYQGILQRVGADVPRFQGARLDVDGVTWHDTQADGTTPIPDSTLFGYVSESSATNLFLHSSVFLNPIPWSAFSGSLTLNAATSPSGEMDANEFVPELTDARHYPSQIINNVNSGTVYTASFYVKTNGLDWVQLLGSNGFTNGNYINYNIVTLQAGATGGSFVGSSIEPVGDGWVRVSFSDTCVATGQGRIVCSPIDSDVAIRLPIYTPAPGNTQYHWGAQLEASTFPSSYIKTEAATAGRDADVLHYPGTGNIDVATGTLKVEHSANWDTSPDTAYLVALNGQGRLAYNFAESVTEMRSFNGTILSDTNPTAAAQTLLPVISRWSASGRELQYGDPPASTDIDGTAYQTGDIHIGVSYTKTDEQWNGTIKNVKIYNVEDA